MAFGRWTVPGEGEQRLCERLHKRDAVCMCECASQDEGAN